MPTSPPAPQKPTAPRKPAALLKPAASQNQAARPEPAATLSPAAQKKLAGEHLRSLLEQKKRRATQTPAWQLIEHHDNAPREPAHQPHGGGMAGDGGETARDPEDRGED